MHTKKMIGYIIGKFFFLKIFICTSQETVSNTVTEVIMEYDYHDIMTINLPFQKNKEAK